MKKQLAGLIGMICSAAIATVAPAADIPYPDALADASVTVTSLANGNADGLLLGNGDLYGLVWERGGELIMRVTKNDIWDGGLTPPKTVRAQSGCGHRRGHGLDGYWSLLQAALSSIALCSRVTAGHGRTGRCPALELRPTGAQARAESRRRPKRCSHGGGRRRRQLYRVPGHAPGKPAVSSLKFTVNGSPNAEYYVDVFDAVGANIHKSGWTASPNNEKPVTIELGGKAVSRVTLYTRTLDGEKATNQIKGVSLELGEWTLPLRFEKPPSLHGDLNIRKP